ncbi:MAG: alkaline phosphatase family protein [Thermoplasmata archaeon]|nr:MAG: alkaline phosphatase family protein [Thermoplasmata archaeon]
MPRDTRARYFPSMTEAVRDAYAHGEEDERLEPLVVVDLKGNPVGRFSEGDVVIFYDIRGEREIELSSALVDDDFEEFLVKKGLNLGLVTMIEYHKDLNVRVAFPPQGKIEDTLSHVLSRNKKTQVKIVESEKAVHLSYFFRGKSEEPIPGEERLIIPSFKIAKPELKPEMNIAEVTEAILTKLADERIHMITANLANVDVVGHTEDERAILTSIEAVDAALGRIIPKAESMKITTIVTADHGTVESWLYPDGTIDTGHTRSAVPFIIVEPEDAIASNLRLREGGGLADVAPTVLHILGIEKPPIMTGSSLLLKSPYENNERERLLLLILDGWGINDETQGNLIHKAATPVMDELLKIHPNTRLQASGEAVGMPKGSVGNSEVGHLHLGAGRIIPSDRMRIDSAIADDSFFKNPAFLAAMQDVKTTGKNLHLLGIVSFYSSHGSVTHLKALLELANKKDVKQVYVHGILGRRGEHAQSGARYINDIEEFTKKLNLGNVVTVIGRHWALDREHNWDRVKRTYDSLVFGSGKHVIIKTEDK